MSRPRKTAREKMSEWVLHCAVNQRHIRRSHPTTEAALKDACAQLLQGHAVNRIVGPNKTISAEQVRIGAQSIDPRPKRSLQTRHSNLLLLVLAMLAFAHRGSRIIQADMWRLVISQISRHPEEHNQDSKNDPDVDTHGCTPTGSISQWRVYSGADDIAAEAGPSTTGTKLDIAATDHIRPIATTTAIPTMHARICTPSMSR
jgi:hypothetical protein